MSLTVWVKPNKTEIKLNDTKATIAKAKDMGWKKKPGRKAVKSDD